MEEIAGVVTLGNRDRQYRLYRLPPDECQVRLSIHPSPKMREWFTPRYALMNMNHNVVTLLGENLQINAWVLIFLGKMCPSGYKTIRSYHGLQDETAALRLSVWCHHSAIRNGWGAVDHGKPVDAMTAELYMMQLLSSDMVDDDASPTAEECA